MKKFSIKTVEKNVRNSEPDDWIDLELSPRNSTCSKCSRKIHKYRLRITHLSRIKNQMTNTKYHLKCAPRDLTKQLKQELFREDAEKNILNTIKEVNKKLINPPIRSGLGSVAKRSLRTDFKLVMEELQKTLRTIQSLDRKGKRKPKLGRYAFISKRS